MSKTVKLTEDSLDQLGRRQARGAFIVNESLGHIPTNEEDAEMAASDAISDVLTRLFGAAGHYVENHDGGTGLVNNEFALNEARRVIERAYESWLGDAEDYTAEPKLHLYRVFFATPDERIFSSQVESPVEIGGQYDPTRAQVVLAAWRKIRKENDLTTGKLLGIDKL